MIKENSFFPKIENPEKQEDVLAREKERELIEQEAKNYEEEPLEEPLALFLTPAEHEIIGSTWEGLGYHPNKPMACFINESSEQDLSDWIEIVNNMRKKLSETLLKDKNFTLIIQDKEGRKKYLFFRADLYLLPLSEQDIESSSPHLYFEIKNFKPYERSKLEIENTEQAMQVIKDFIQRTQESKRQELIELAEE